MKTKPVTLNHDVQLPWMKNSFFPAETHVELIDDEPFQIEGMQPMIQVRLPDLETILGVPVEWITR